MYDKIKETGRFLLDIGIEKAQVGIVLGTGLGGIVNMIQIEKRIPYHDIPNFPVSTVSGHSGTLIYGELSGKKVVAMQGRFHYYEGWEMSEVTFPIRVMKFLGIDTLIVSNACGGVNPEFKVGDVMIIKDHINMMPEHPLRGENDDRFGPRFVDMHEPYNLEMIALMKKIASEKGIEVKEGIYLALQGPTFETPAEYRMVKLVGADAVGMSTVPEVIVAKHMNMECFGLSVITDLGIEGKIEEVSHEAVQIAAKSSEKKISTLVEDFIGKLILRK
ncbi:purine-nucleoside phosphorylase [Lutimonas saemankumensis]|uniref:purine-nucleoside phosphorylase n=1 Tax=Lutimonas saemankumensis TaxID=483016 RepID=UPI001CD3D609|nr:purine-nucleoside phosphorylase [Lutimonas saemankumensis]MCA0931125.1 purine-nucleoside phosphorylase [Lutimonas saemankumensis]